MAMSSLRASALRLARGTALSQLVVVVATPVLTRNYSPGDFGQLAMFVSSYTILVGISTLKFELSILLPKVARKAELLTLLAASISSAACIVILVSMTVGRVAFGQPTREFLLLPFAIFSGALLSLGQQWCSRKKAFSDIGTSLLVSAGFNVSLAIILCYTKIAHGLIISFSFGLAMAAAYVMIKRRTVIIGIKEAASGFRLPAMATLFREYRNLPVHVLPNTLLVSLAYTSLPLIMAHFFDAGTIGLYSVANRFLVLPSILIGGAISDVFRAEFVSRLHGNADYRGLFNKVLGLIFVCVVPVFGLMWLFSPLAFNMVFGTKFAGAGEFARYLCIGVVGNLFVQIFSYIFIALEKTRTSLILQLLISIGPLLGFIVGAAWYDIRVALLAMSAITFCASCLFIYVAYRSVRLHKPLPDAGHVALPI